MDKEAQLDVYHRIFGFSLRLIHQCTTNLATRLGEKFDEVVARENAREAYLNRQKMDVEADKIDANGQTMGETESIKASGIIETTENGSPTESEYTVLQRSSEKSNYRLKYKGFTYQSGQRKCAPGLDVPTGIFKCTRLNKKCDGTIETIASSNGRAQIVERDPHTCG